MSRKKDSWASALTELGASQQREAVFALARQVAQESPRHLPTLLACVVEPALAVCDAALLCLEELAAANAAPSEGLLQDVVSRLPLVPLPNLHVVCASAIRLAALTFGTSPLPSTLSHPLVAALTVRADAAEACGFALAEFLSSATPPRCPLISTADKLTLALPFLLHVVTTAAVPFPAQAAVLRPLAGVGTAPATLAALSLFLLGVSARAGASPPLLGLVAQALADRLLRLPPPGGPRRLCEAVEWVLSEAVECQQRGQDPTPMLGAVLTVVQNQPTALHGEAAAAASGCFLLLALLLFRARGDSEVAAVLHLCRAAVDAGRATGGEVRAAGALAAHALAAPLLAVMASSSWSIHHIAAAALLRDLTVSPPLVVGVPAHHLRSTSADAPERETLSHGGVASLQAWSSIISRLTVDNQSRADSELCVNVNFGLEWMRTGDSILAECPLESNSEGLFTVVVGFLLLLPVPGPHLAEWTEAAVAVVRRGAAARPAVGPQLLPAALSLLDAADRPPRVKLLVLHALPHLGVQDWASGAPVVRLLTQFLAVPGLRAVALRLLAAAVGRQFKAMPPLLEALAQPTEDAEERLAALLAVQTLCGRYPVQGADFLPLLTRTLTADLDARHIVIALEALGSLCDHGAVAFTASWRTIRRPVLTASQQSSIVLCALCRFLRRGAGIVGRGQEPPRPTDKAALHEDAEDPEEEDIADPLCDKEVLQCLWTATTHGDAEVQREAYAALALFPAEVLASDCADPSDPLPEDIHREQQYRRALFGRLCGRVLGRLLGRTLHGWDRLANALWTAEVGQLAAVRRSLPPEKTVTSLPSLAAKLCSQLADDYAKSPDPSGFARLAVLSCYTPRPPTKGNPPSPYSVLAVQHSRHCPWYPHLMFNILLAQAWRDFALRCSQGALPPPKQTAAAADTVVDISEALACLPDTELQSAVHLGFSLAGAAAVADCGASAAFRATLDGIARRGSWACFAEAVATATAALPPANGELGATVRRLLRPLAAPGPGPSAGGCLAALAAGSLCLAVSAGDATLPELGPAVLCSPSGPTTTPPPLTAPELAAALQDIATAWEALRCSTAPSLPLAELPAATALALALAAAALALAHHDAGGAIPPAVLGALHALEAGVAGLEVFFARDGAPLDPAGSVPFPLGLGAAAIVGYALLCPALYGLQRVARPALQHAVRRCAAAVSHVMQQWGPLSQTELFANICVALGHLLYAATEEGLRGETLNTGAAAEELLLLSFTSPALAPEARAGCALGIGAALGLPLLPLPLDGSATATATAAPAFQKTFQKATAALAGLHAARADPFLKAVVALVLSRLVSRPPVPAPPAAPAPKAALPIAQFQPDGIVCRTVQFLSSYPSAEPGVECSPSLYSVLRLLAADPAAPLPAADWGGVLQPLLPCATGEAEAAQLWLTALGRAVAAGSPSAAALLRRICTPARLARWPAPARPRAFLAYASAQRPLGAPLAELLVECLLAPGGPGLEGPAVALFQGRSPNGALDFRVPVWAVLLKAFVGLGLPLIDDPAVGPLPLEGSRMWWTVTVDRPKLQRLCSLLAVVRAVGSVEDVGHFLAAAEEARPLYPPAAGGSVGDLAALSRILLAHDNPTATTAAWKDADLAALLTPVRDHLLRPAAQNSAQSSLLAAGLAAASLRLPGPRRAEFLSATLAVLEVSDAARRTATALLLAWGCPFLFAAVAGDAVRLCRSPLQSPERIACAAYPPALLPSALRTVLAQWRSPPADAAMWKGLDSALRRVHAATLAQAQSQPADVPPALRWVALDVAERLGELGHAGPLLAAALPYDPVDVAL